MPSASSHRMPQRKPSSTTTSLLGEPCVQIQQHARSPLAPAVKARGARALGTQGSRNPSQKREDSTPDQSERSRRDNIEYTSRTSPTELQHHARHQDSGSTNQRQPFPLMKTRDVLKHPRLQQVTGLVPGKVNLWGGRELPPDELSRLVWAMALPQPFPSKRPRGERLTPLPLGVKKTET
ncbi:hypothetical protein SAMD00023353_0501050 [Rosellinia necatrix]|uniref:Uncharacterized protein n=1 Tax=Rosellinia necatrix TaxID=77044 RepID=A0A1S7UKE0_ROSNE|nr:hypothetical protein SAMD00023353_0501050 [Rosellinia necatrix]